MSDSKTLNLISDEQIDRILSDRKSLIDENAALQNQIKLLLDRIAAHELDLIHYTVEEISEKFFKVSPRQLQRYAKDKKLTPRKLFGKVLYSARQLIEFLAQYDQQDEVKDVIEETERRANFSKKYQDQTPLLKAA